MRLYVTISVDSEVGNDELIMAKALNTLLESGTSFPPFVSLLKPKGLVKEKQEVLKDDRAQEKEEQEKLCRNKNCKSNEQVPKIRRWQD